MPASRYSVTEYPTKAPAVDYITNSAVGPFVDTGRDVVINGRVFGRIYLSESTVREMAESLGILETTTQKQIDDAYLRGKVAALKEGLGDELVRVADVLARWGDALGVADSDDSSVEVAQR